MVVGTGDRDKERFDRDQEEYIKCRHHESYGILSIELETNKKMQCKFISNDGNIIDTFTIVKSNAVIA